MPNALTTASILMCPHGGIVSVVPGNNRAMVNGAPIILATDTFLVAGCPFLIGPKPSPCIKVQWVSWDMQTTVGGMPTLSAGSVGLCLSAEQLPQGPVVISSTQPKVSTR